MPAFSSGRFWVTRAKLILLWDPQVEGPGRVDSQAMAYASPYYGDRNFMMKAFAVTVFNGCFGSLAWSEGLFFGNRSWQWKISSWNGKIWQSNMATEMPRWVQYFFD